MISGSLLQSTCAVMPCSWITTHVSVNNDSRPCHIGSDGLDTSSDDESTTHIANTNKYNNVN